MAWVKGKRIPKKLIPIEGKTVSVWVMTNDKGERYGTVNYKNKPEFIVVHHDAGHGKATAKSINKGHKHRKKPGNKKRNFICIGYHYIVLPDGTIEVGRYERMNGAHAPGLNRKSLGVCVIGNFHDHVPKMLPTEKQMERTSDLIANLCARYKIPTSHMLEHKTVYERYWNPFHEQQRYTACPGKDFPFWELKSMTEAKLSSGLVFQMEEV